MSNSKKLLQAAAGSAGGAGLNVEEVFSTYLYEGNGSTQTITNGIDLDGEGGLVWIKSRTDAYNHYLHDTTTSEPWHFLQSNLTDARNTHTGNEDLTISAFNSNGFVIGSGSGVNNGWGGNNSDFASWTFRKAPKFFDVVTYTGTGSAQTISHNLGSVPGTIIIKGTDYVENWIVYHRSLGETKYIQLNTTGAASTSSNTWNNTAPTSTEFTVNTLNAVNESGYNYVAYLFAHNDGDGDFGPTGDQDIIKCGSYSGTSPEINLGWEPQWILSKNASTTNDYSDWMLVDNMRALTADGTNSDYFRANESTAEENTSTNALAPIPTPTGFRLTSAGSTSWGGANTDTYIYIAIRRGPMAVPESATDVFQVGTVQNNTPKDVSPAPDFPVDFVLHHAAANSSTGNKLAINRLANDLLYTNLTGGSSSYGTYSSYSPFDHMDNVQLTGLGAANGAAWMWKRAPNYFDVVAYTGNGTAGRTVSHNLGVAPEMMWVKRRDVSNGWKVYHSALGAGSSVALNETVGEETNGNGCWNSTAPTDSVFSLGPIGDVNASGNTYIAYLFASLDGVSKVGSFSYTYPSDLTVDCGFSSGPRFLMIKKTSATGGWIVIDTERGFTSGNDPWLQLNSTAAENTSWDIADITPTGSGFIIPSNGLLGSGDYIFYAVSA
jgi:hypothetical protein